LGNFKDKNGVKISWSKHLQEVLNHSSNSATIALMAKKTKRGAWTIHISKLRLESLNPYFPRGGAA
jgi:hypothetical protein